MNKVALITEILRSELSEQEFAHVKEYVEESLHQDGEEYFEKYFDNTDQLADDVRLYCHYLPN